MSTIYRYTTPVPKDGATGTVAAVYAQIREDFLLADGPLMTLSRAPEILAPTWALLREAEIAGPVSRADREVVAVAVSAANDCPFCLDAHTALGHSVGEHSAVESLHGGGRPSDPALAALADWAAASARPGERLPAAPFPAEHAPVFVGTALATHFITRIVSSLLEERVGPGVHRSKAVRRLMGRFVRKSAPIPPGRSLDLLPEVSREAPAWAGTGPVGTAYTALSEAVDGADLSEAVRVRIREETAAWDGTPPPVYSTWPEEALAGLSERDRANAGLALRAAVTPYRISDDHVGQWRRFGGDDADLIRVVAFGALAGTERMRASLEARTAKA